MSDSSGAGGGLTRRQRIVVQSPLPARLGHSRCQRLPTRTVTHTSEAMQLPVRLLAVLVLMVMVAALCCEGRYLPTRSDESSMRAIKQLLTAMLSNAEQQQYPSRLDQLPKTVLFSPNTGYD